VEKYRVNPEAVVLAGTGDNPATLLGCGGHAVISLGTSYTVNGVMKSIVPSESGAYNIFGYAPGKAMALSVFTNGGKVHDHFLRKYLVDSSTRDLTQQDWNDYCSAAGNPLLYENEPLILPYLQDECVPLKRRGVVRDGLGEDDGNANIRALAVSQALSLKLHSDHLQDVDTLCVVGGGARNHFLRQLISDVFNAKTYLIRDAGYAAPLGCAISAARAALGISYEEAVDRFVAPDESSYRSPVRENTRVARGLLNTYSALENQAPV
jgi:sugar (pentulose or hexulose) kinase